MATSYNSPTTAHGSATSEHFELQGFCSGVGSRVLGDPVITAVLSDPRPTLAVTGHHDLEEEPGMNSPSVCGV
ncbi:hypothetical protein [Mycolicibacterium sp.]|uniref:hypothetical protein n=1 Tax=Mycolicibacterium sp. TaxID=2320850 RepID=UPI0037C8822A